MALSEGDRLPDGVWLEMRAQAGVRKVSVNEFTRGRKIVIFAVPGAFTPTCNNTHIPSFIKEVEAFKAKGVEAVVCLSVNDPFVMQAWGEASGATAGGILMMADADGAFTKAAGFDFSVADAGLFSRSARYAMLVEDGVVKRLQVEASAGECSLSRGDSFLAAL